MSDAKGTSRGEQYARIFRKAGVLAGKGDLAAAITALHTGLDLAHGFGDGDMERVFAEQIATHQRELNGPG
ncbi:MAG TPA: hypothetical protein VMW17_16300 [Candidatus Binatia bacterium]|nr:hypothetical protein [Candidatus Binatia bacterium]